MPVVNFHNYRSAAALDEAFGKGGWIYVGRRNIGYALPQSPVANPFVDRRGKMGTVVSDPIGEYKKWLWARMKQGDKGVIGVLSQITPKTALVCWCDPAPCHANVIEKAAAWWQSQQQNPTKALSIQQPWAWLIIRPDITDCEDRAYLYNKGLIKDIENRAWATTFRGRFWVHTGKKVERAGYEFLRREHPDLYALCPPEGEIETGGIVGSANLTDCVTHHDSQWFFGDKGFVLADAQPHPFVALPGRLGFFDVNI